VQNEIVAAVAEKTLENRQNCGTSEMRKNRATDSFRGSIYLLVYKLNIDHQLILSTLRLQPDYLIGPHSHSSLSMKSHGFGNSFDRLSGQFLIPVANRHVPERHDADQIFIAVHNSQAADLFLLHEFDRLLDVLSFGATDNSLRHHLIGSGFGGFQSFSRGTDGDIAIAENAHQALPVANRKHANVAPPHNAGGLL
jgi:hypothetical protein